MPTPARPISPAPQPRAEPFALPATLNASWHRWIVEQRLHGCTVESMLQVVEGAGLARVDAERIIATLDENPAYAVAQMLQQRHRKLESVVLNLQRLWSSDPQYRTVEKRASLSDEEFAERYVRGCRPVVLTGHTRDWPAMRKWSADDLKRRFGHLDVDIQSGRNADDKYEQNKLLLTKRVNLGAFVDQVVRAGVTNDYYLTANNELLRRPDFAPLLKDIGSLPPLCDRSQLRAPLVVLVRPSRHRHAAAPRHADALPHPGGRDASAGASCHRSNGRVSTTFATCSAKSTWNGPTRARFPAFEEATVLEVVVESGETMFLPLGWWHQVASLDVSLSFSYSCLAVPNHFEYPDPAAPASEPPMATAGRHCGCDAGRTAERRDRSWLQGRRRGTVQGRQCHAIPFRSFWHGGSGKPH